MFRDKPSKLEKKVAFLGATLLIGVSCASTQVRQFDNNSYEMPPNSKVIMPGSDNTVLLDVDGDGSYDFSIFTRRNENGPYISIMPSKNNLDKPFCTLYYVDGTVDPCFSPNDILQLGQ